MCGICCIVFTTREAVDIVRLEEDCKQWLEACGYYAALGRRGPDHSASILLSEGGPGGMVRPVMFCTSSVLSMRSNRMVKQPLQNAEGDLLLYNGEIFDGLGNISCSTDFNDATELFRQLQSCTEENLLNFVSGLTGPFAFVYFQKKLNKLHIARDFFGQRSLVLTRKDGGLVISSILCHDFDAGVEFPAGCLVTINLTSLRQAGASFGDVICTQEGSFPQRITAHFTDVAIAHFTTNPELLELSTKLKHGELTVHAAANDSYVHCMPELLRLYETETLSFIEHLKWSVEKRLDFLERRFEGEKTTSKCARIAVLFSGGVDCLLLAVLIDQLWPLDWPIDLLNVAFERRSTFQCSDRLQGRHGLAALKASGRRPGRQWNLVEVDVGQAELSHWRQRCIGRLIRPKCAVIDEGVACALWFAARGRGRLDGAEGFQSSARTLFLGMGADELFAGYCRHRRCYQLGGWEALTRELRMELERIWHRNCGRDDRVIGDHGKESHLPFLDQNFVKFCNNLPMDCKARLDLPRGLGEKLIVRLALFHLGLGAAALVPKKAMQFGSGLAKLENSKEKGSDLCPRIIF